TAPYTGTGNNAVTAGSYNFTITDANGCIAQTSIVVTQPSTLIANAILSAPVLCNGGLGQVSVFANGGTLPYTGTGNFSVLAGTYNYTVTDANGCANTANIIVTQPIILSVTLGGVNPTCNGNSNGSATATPNGGTAPYSYLWSNSATGASAINLVSGTYTVTVTDANGCTAINSITLTQPSLLTASSTITSAILCNGGNGQVLVSGAGGILPYSGTGNFTVLTGNATFTITDGNGCIASTTINVPQPTAVVASSSVASPIACFGGTGNIIVTAVGGTPAYSGTGSFSVGVGTYTYSVTDANGCPSSTTITITQPTALTPAATISSPILCNGGNATVNISATGGTPNYNGTGNFITTVGVHSYTVIDANGCAATVSINVPQPTLLTSSILSQNVTCNGLNNGSASVSAAGGVPNYTYLWSNGTTTATATNLAPGSYSVTVTDVNGCTSISNCTISQPTNLTSSSIQTSNILCFGGTGNVFVTAAGGTAPYSGIGNFSVNAGPHFYTVTDANGCTSITSILISQPSQLSAIATQTNPILCFGGQATVSITGSGGTPSYVSTGNVNSFAGNNTYIIQDANGCTASTTLLITQPTAITANFNNVNVTCFGFSNGTSTATVSGGTPGYTYLWNTGSILNSITAQPAGIYNIQVTDANNCISNFSTTITQPAQVVSTANIILPIACFGGQAIVLVNGAGGTPPYAGNGTFNVFAGTYTYTLTDQNGCTGSTTINVTQPAPFIATATITSPVPCNGGQATVVLSASGGTAPYTGTGTFNVTAGTYTYTIVDANGCIATTTITVSQPAVLIASATLLSPILCNGGNALVQVSATGGTAPYVGTGNFTVVAGSYTYLVTDANGCTNSTSISVTQPSLLVSNVVPTQITCFGANNGAAIVFYSGGTAPYSVLWSNGLTTNSVNNLAPGNYTVNVSDANGCQNTLSFTITQPNLLVASVNQLLPILCFNGTATVNVSAIGGTAPYNGVGTFFPVAGSYIYTVTDAQGCVDTQSIVITQPTQLVANATITNPIACFGGQATVNITAAGGVAPYIGTGNFNVSSGNQAFTVTDANGCSFTVNLFISQPTQLLSTIASQNISCNGAANGTATITPIGGTPGYNYVWSNGDTLATTIGLIPGLYSVTVTDTNGCQTSNQITITQPVTLVSAASISTPVFCNGGNAVVAVSATGGTAPYVGTGNFNTPAGTTTYIVSDANGCIDSVTLTITQPAALIASVVQTSNVLCNGGNATVNVSAIGGTPTLVGTGPFTVVAGWQNYTVTDNYGCTDTTSIFITQPTLLTATSNQTSQVLCNGGTGLVTVTAAGGTPNYTGQGTFTVIAGTYAYTVTDANGCTANTTITIAQPNPLQAVAAVTSPIVCNAGTGVINISGTGGTAPYTGTGNFTVSAGTYTYPITDANGCASSVTITISQPSVLSLSLTQINVNCNGFATGSITANPAGGQGPYTYLWSNGQTTQTISSLLAGTYTVTVTDFLGCTVSGNATITQPVAPILLQESHVNVLCFGNNTGSINLTVSGGTSPYTYAWSNTALTQDINTLVAGTYSVIVTDANGCNALLSVAITQPLTPLTIAYAVTNVSCFGLIDGAIDVTPQGGTAPYTYFWTTGQTSQDISNIAPGQYIVAITDVNNCVSSTVINVTQPASALSASITQLPITCYGYSDGQLTATGIGGTAPYSYVWTPTGQITSVATLLGPGNYTVLVTDANGCTITTNDVLSSPPILIASYTVSDNVVCLPSTVTFTNASVGSFVSSQWTLSNGTTNTANQFTTALNSVGCINATLQITTANGCIADTTINNIVCVVPGPTAAFGASTSEIDFVTGQLDFVNNSQNYSGSVWDFGDGGTSNIDNPTHYYPSSTIGAYDVVLVVYDANGCTDTAFATYQSTDVVRLTVPNAFTPNGDGLNDDFLPIISNSDQVKYYRFEVYNRWGQLVFESSKTGEGWDGKYKGKLVQFGTYTWKVSYDVVDQDSMKANGHVTLLR
ncbi:MAG: hypothetical protein EBR74_06955, partial [Flavobacteriia bacterium]|nr:hypothetical protein [Flavobacteriia bacterium]